MLNVTGHCLGPESAYLNFKIRYNPGKENGDAESLVSTYLDHEAEHYGSEQRRYSCTHKHTQ